MHPTCTRLILLAHLAMIPMTTPALPHTDLHQLSRLRTELRKTLDDEFRRWYPLALDSAQGGFYSDLNSRWEIEGPQQKMIVTQARHVWSAANAALFYDEDTRMRDIAAYGARYLSEVMWDQEYGGFYWLMTRNGTPVREGGEIIKRAYGNAFAIYGLAACVRASGDTSALHLAQKAFDWLERHSHDPLHGGYFQFMTREGKALPEGFREPPKDQNSTIHLLEAFAELYRVWPDTLLRERLLELLTLIRDRITTSDGYMRLFFSADWTPVSFRDAQPDVRERNYGLDHISFCHDIEVTYLLLEAAEALGMPNDPATIRVAKALADHTLKYGWDPVNGGVHDRGYLFAGETTPRVIQSTKEWWGQVEALNTLQLLAGLFPDDPLEYGLKFLTQWEYCKQYAIDAEQGGWYWYGTDSQSGAAAIPKSSIWKCNYHTSRSLINCINRLGRQIALRPSGAFPPVNREATPEARALLERLYAERGKHIFSGHHNDANLPDRYPDRVEQLTGKRPAVWGADFIGSYRPENGRRLVDEAVKHAHEGYIITLMWHAGRPQDDPPFGWKESVQGKMTDQQWDELLTPGSPLNTRWAVQVDSVAAFLSALRDQHIPVLWRPYHEQNGVWFWWGNRKGPRGSAGLYRMLYDRLVHLHHLNNLIWVWNSNAPRQLLADEAFDYADFFPGLDCVDVLATDIYHGDYRPTHHDRLAELAGGKLIALGEIGSVPPPSVFDDQPLWSWFMIWADFVDTHNTPEQMRALYSSPRVLPYSRQAK
jgi:cellobiose epimerase